MTTEYHNYGLTLTKNQINKLERALKLDCETTLRISNKNLTGNMQIPLTETQINKIKKSKTGVQLKLSKSQLHYMEKTGGFLPLLALIPLIAGALGAAGGVAGGVASAVNSTKQAAEQVRHHKEMENILKSGSGIISNAIEPIPIVGKTLSNALKKIGLGGCVKELKGVKWGEGIYLERKGSGLFLGRQGGGN